MTGGSFSIEGRRTVVTGGTAGIGLAVASHFVEAGAHVVISGRRNTGAEIAQSVGARFIPMDVADTESVTSGMENAAAVLGGIDILILNAGIDLAVGTVDNLDVSAFRTTVDVNLMGVVHGLRAAIPHMALGGVVIITSSPSGRVTMEGLSAYSASKAAVDSFTRTAAIELAPKGIRVTAVLPGIVRTEMGGGATGDGSELAVLTAGGVQREAAEMGPIYQFLASDAAAPLIGATVQADDGISAGYGTLVTTRIFGEE
jgi:NAD(P)-dependent dehydrogenase (short-subunit alcohol dehydrogenase family)